MTLLLLEELDNARESVLVEELELDSIGDEGPEVTAGALRASVRSLWMTSLFAFSRTGRFLKANDPNSSLLTGSLSLRFRPSRTCHGM